MTDQTTEEWRDVPGYEGHYMVSSLGRVKSFHYGKERIMRSYEKLNEYRKIGLTLNKVLRTHLVHRLVAQAFIGEIPKGYTVNHIDGVKSNSALSNLEIVTPATNTEHAVKVLGRANMTAFSKLSKEQVIEIIHLLNTTTKTTYEIAEMFGITPNYVSNICHGKAWKQYSANCNRATHTWNNDAAARNPSARASRNAEILHMYDNGYEQQEIAAKFKITPGRVCQIIAENRPQMERQS